MANMDCGKNQSNVFVILPICLDIEIYPICVHGFLYQQKKIAVKYLYSQPLNVSINTWMLKPPPPMDVVVSRHALLLLEIMYLSTTFFQNT